MTWCPNAGRRHAELARIGLGVSDELGNCLSRDQWIYHHDVGHDNNAGDGRDVADEIEIQLVIERRVDRVVSTDQQQRVAVRSSVWSPPFAAGVGATSLHA